MLGDYVLQRKREFNLIPQERKKLLTRLASAITHDISLECSADLIFICTHNSRRSLLAQIWAQFSSLHYEVIGVRCFSGGTEATAFNPRAVAALERAGVSVSITDSNSTNPLYKVLTGNSDTGDIMSSKRYDDPVIPSEGFIAVMVCSDADEACPVVPGVSERIVLTYQDPGGYDGTSSEQDKYDEICIQIATEMLYLFQYVRLKVIQITPSK